MSGTKITMVSLLTQDSEKISSDITDVSTLTDASDVRNIALNFENEVDICVRALERYCQLIPDDAIEITNTIINMYLLSGIGYLKMYLCYVAEKSTLPIQYKIMVINGLFDKGEERYLYSILNKICGQLVGVSTPIKVEMIHRLMKSPDFRDESLSHFYPIINDTKLNCEYRYKIILSLESNPDTYFLTESCKVFARNPNNNPRLRILACQCILKYELLTEIEDILLCFGRDTNLEYNLRADAVDVLLHRSTGETLIVAKQLIHELGTINEDGATIYRNAQNVHMKDMEESVLEGIEFLYNYTPKRTKNSLDLTLQQVVTKVKKYTSKHFPGDRNKVKLSLNRILLDRALYSKYQCTIGGILIKLWVYISNHVDKTELKRRLLDELIDMSETCSTGFISRLVNVISGHGDHSIRISWEEQIKANFFARLNVLIRSLTYDNITVDKKRVLVNDYFLQNRLQLINGFVHKTGFCMLRMVHLATDCDGCGRPKKIEYTPEYEREIISEFIEQAIDEMALPPNVDTSRRCFLTLMRQNIPVIKEELYKEFNVYLTDQDFDTYLMKAVLIYSGEMS